MKTIDVELGGYTFKLSSLPGDPAFDMFYGLLRPAIPVIGEALKAAKGDAKSLLKMEVNAELGLRAVGELVQVMPLEDLKKIRDGLFRGAQVRKDGGKYIALDKEAFDVVFGEIGVHQSFVLMFEAIKLNFASFFGSAVNAGDKVASLFNSPKTPSTGGPSTA
jgi:hypothetical protein